MLMANMCQGTINTDVKLDAIDLTNNPRPYGFKILEGIICRR